MANPAFANSPAFSAKAAAQAAAKAAAAPAIPTAGDLAQQYAQPDATPEQMERMTYEDTLAKTVGSFAILLVGAAIGWFVPILAIPAALVGFVLALVNIFKKKPSPPLVIAYAAVEGIFVGGISMLFSQLFDGIVPMAVIGTLGVVGITLALFASGKVRASKRATKIFLVAMIGTPRSRSSTSGSWRSASPTRCTALRDFVIPGTGIPLGIPLGILVVLLAAYSLVLDFDGVKRGVEGGAPRIFGWTAAFGIMLTVVWLYLEILRLISFFMPRN